MARYSATLRNQNGVPVAGALVYVTVSDTNALAVLLDDSEASLGNPFLTGADGAVVFNTDPSFCDIVYYLGGREVGADRNVGIGNVADSNSAAALAIAESLLPAGTVPQYALRAVLLADGYDLNAQAPSYTDNAAAYAIYIGDAPTSPTDALGLYIQTTFLGGSASATAAVYAAAGPGGSPSPFPYSLVVNGPGTSTTNAASQAYATGKVDLVPLVPLSPIQNGYAAGLASYLKTWWDTTNNRFTYVNGGGQYFAQISTTDHSTWMMALSFGGSIYLKWQLAVSAGNAADKTKYGAMIEAQWTNWKSLYTDNNFQTGGGGMVNTMDDGSVLTKWLRQIGTYYSTTYGTANADYVKACGYLLELIPYLCQFFRYTIRPADISYGVTTPVLGTVFKSGQYGMLYSAESNHASVVFYGYGSCPLESANASVALWLSQQTAVPAITTSWQGALRAYAVNTEAWIAAKGITPAPADATRGVQGVAYALICLDPNVNANNDPTINGGVAQTGTYDVNQVFLKGQNAYFGKDIRGLAATWEAATQAYAVLCGDLYTATGTASYKAKVTAVFTAYVDPAGYGRTNRLGIPFLATVRDPHSIGMNIAAMVKTGITLGILTPTHPFTQALFCTATKYIVSSVNGLVGINPQGQEFNFLEGSWTWEDTRGYQGLGGQAQRNYMMMGAHGLAFIGATQLFPTGTEIAVGSGIASEFAYAQIPSLVGALMDTTQEVMTREGGQFIGRVSFGTNVFYLDYNASGNPFINFSSGRALSYEVSNTKLTYGGSGVDQFSVSDAGVVKARGTITASTTP